MTHLLLPFKESFFLSTSKKLLKKCLKCLKRPEVLVGTFRESAREYSNCRTHPPASLARRFHGFTQNFPSTYVRNLWEDKYVENIFERNPNETAQNWDWKEEVLFLVLGVNLTVNRSC